jgi:hypothetical protein
MAASEKLISVQALADSAGKPYSCALFESETPQKHESDDVIEVRSAQEIIATLDAQGKLEGIPFMPEMLAFCGQRHRVFKTCEQTCAKGEPRHLSGAVHLKGVRCDGSAHQNCQAKCLMVWKEAWIRRVEAAPSERNGTHNNPVEMLARSDGQGRILAACVPTGDGEITCQATELRSASSPLPLGSNPRYFLKVAAAFFRGRVSRTALWDLLLWGRGTLICACFIRWARTPWNSEGYRKTPSRRLDLRPCEYVRVRSAFEILRTLDRNGRNRGMVFKPEMFHYCGRTLRVLSRLDRRIDEHTRRFMEFQNECILLEDVWCHGQRCFCSRSNYHYWREIWLERSTAP